MLALILCNPADSDITRTIHINDTQCAPQVNIHSLKCNSTLIIAPSHLVAQWKNEIDKHFKPYCLNCITITTSSEHKKITYQDILQSQIVIVSSHYFASFDYYSIHIRRDATWIAHINPNLPSKEEIGSNAGGSGGAGDSDVKMNNHSCGIRRSARLFNKEKQNEGYQDLTRGSPLFALFHWHRIILDEAPDYMKQGRICRCVLDLSSDFKWYVSATPFPTRECIAFCAQFLGIKINNQYVRWDKLLDKPLGYILHCLIYDNLFLKNTSDTIGKDNYLPEIENSCKYFELHPIEQILYDIAKSRRGTKYQDLKLERQICAGLLDVFERKWFKRDINHFPQDTDVREGIKKIRKSNECYLMKLYEVNLVWYAYQIKKGTNNVARRKVQLEKYNMLEKELILKKSEYKQSGKTWNLREAFGDKKYVQYEYLCARIKKAKKKIEILDLETKRYEKELKQIKNGSLLELRQQVQEWELQFQRHDSNSNSNININGANVADKLIFIVNKYGSKLAHLINFVKQLLFEPDGSKTKHKLIIFSLFGDTLESIKQLLDLIHIRSSLLVGSIHRRRIAMSAFQKHTLTIDSERNNSNCNNVYNIDKNNCKNNQDVKKFESRVMLLSIQRAASGTNLTEATHVILCDPTPGTSSEAYAKEKQAVGRAVRQGMSFGKEKKIIKVVRIVVKNTIEQETHIRNEKIRNDTNEKQTNR